MTAPFRLPASAPTRFGTEIDRAEPVGFRFGGRTGAALYGDTLTSGLMASGVRVISRSSLLGRPRGLMAVGIEDHMPVVVDGDGGVWAAVSGDEIVLREGLRARVARPGADGALRRFGAAAPDRRGLPLAQKLAERLRRALPLPGARLPAIEPAPFARRHTCDALVIGAGLAGLSAAAALRSAGLDVRVVEASHRAGGIADLYPGRIDGRPLAEWAASQAGDLRDREALSFSATAIEIDPDGAVTVVERLDPQRPGRVALRLFTASAVVLATGFRERPLVFPDNDRPGVMLAGSARALLRRQAVAPGARVVVATSDDEGYRAAMDFRDAGVAVDLVLDARADPQGAAVEMAKALGVPVSLSSVVTGLEYDKRRQEIVGVQTQNRFGEGATARARTLPADALIVSGGFAFRDELVRHVALGSGDGLHIAQRGPNAIDAVAGGWAAGAAAAIQLGRHVAREEPTVDATPDETGETLRPTANSFRTAGAASAFVDFGADVTLADLARAVGRSGAAPSTIARQLGLGLGAEAGRLSADLAALALHELADDRAAFDGPKPGRATLGMRSARSELR